MLIEVEQEQPVAVRGVVDSCPMLGILNPYGQMLNCVVWHA